MKNQILTFASILFFFVSCSSSQHATDSSNISAQQLSDASLNAVLWQQNAAEYDALCYQAYNAAIDYLKKDIEGGADYDGFPAAIVMDLDETVLDNSPYNAQLIIENKAYSSKSWNEWVRLANAELVPGAKKFIEYAQNLNLRIIYISNRTVDMLEPTMVNLQEKGIQLNPEELILKEDHNEKIERRQMVSDEYSVIMLVGDNLADFGDEFEGDQKTSHRKEVVEMMAEEFGRKLIVLPNTMYGGWESALKNYLPENSGDIDGVHPYLKGFR